jgi:hypothetical protein
MIPSDEAMAMLHRWREDGIGLSVDFKGKGVEVSFGGRVISVSPDELQIVSDVTKFKLSLADAQFTYTKPNIVPPEYREAVSEKLVGCLMIFLPSPPPLGTWCYLYEEWAA